MIQTTYPHHSESIEHMITHYKAQKDIEALYLIGSVATGTERPDSDLDGVAVVNEAYFRHKQESGGLEEVYKGKCTYPGGYFNIHYTTRQHMAYTAQKGSEPMRNQFVDAKLLFGGDPELYDLARRIPLFPGEEAEEKKMRFYCAMKMMHGYHWQCCKPQGFMRVHAACSMVYHLYRLILLENEILFPSVRKLEEYAKRASNVPEGIFDISQSLLSSLSDEDCAALIKAYEAWTSYDYPKDHNFVMNHFSDPYET